MNLDAYLERWNLTPDGEAITTPSSVLLPVRQSGQAAMLKIATGEEEERGAALMVWWQGEGAARVLAHEGNALLLERAERGPTLIELAENGHDDEATRILCAAASRLHTPRNRPLPPTLVPLPRWFAELEPASRQHGGILRQSAAEARALLAEPREIATLHGDVHHGNFLDFGERGWLAIDPKGLIGERGFDFANIFCNPSIEVATAPGRLARQASIVAEATGIERRRLLQWILAYAGLSAAWSMGDGDAPELALAVAEIAANELG